MATFFTGWAGFGSAIALGALVEPVDTNYARYPIALGNVDSGRVTSVTGGTVGPASTSWGVISYMGLYDALTGGNLLFWWPLRLPLAVAVGQTITDMSGSQKLVFPEIGSGTSQTKMWPANCYVGYHLDGRPLTSAVNLQVTAGVLNVMTASLSNTVTMASLPSSQPGSGSGRLWNNGGVISVA